MFLWGRRKKERGDNARPNTSKPPFYDLSAPSSYKDNERALGECMARALRQLCQPAQVVEAMGGNLTTPGLIILTDCRHTKWVPIYQGPPVFGSIALEINQILRVHWEPCAVVNWWHTVHPWLDEKPVKILASKDTGTGERLRKAARLSLGKD